MVKEIERAGLPVVHICTVTPISLTVGANRIVPAVAIPYPLGNPELAPEGWYIDQDFIPRRSTSASIVVKGVKKGENPDLTIMWTILGYPPCGIAVPLFVAAGANQPAYMCKSKDSDHALMCDQALARRARIFPLKRGNGKNYFDIGLAQFFMHNLFRLEDTNFQETEKMMEKQYAAGKIDRSAVISLYDRILSEEPQL